MLTAHRACHALFHYATLARKNYEFETDTIQLEGENRLVNNFALFKSVAILYGVEPEEMLHFWHEIDLQFGLLGIPRVPLHYRFAAIPQIG